MANSGITSVVDSLIAGRAYRKYQLSLHKTVSDNIKGAFHQKAAVSGHPAVQDRVYDNTVRIPQGVNAVKADNFGNFVKAAHIAQGSQDDFGKFLKRVAKDKVQKVRKAESQMDRVASADDVNNTQLMAVISESEIALQELVLVRDKFISAYQEIVRMAL